MELVSAAQKAAAVIWMCTTLKDRFVFKVSFILKWKIAVLKGEVCSHQGFSCEWSTALQAHSRALFFHTFPIYSGLSLFFFTADVLGSHKSSKYLRWFWENGLMSYTLYVSYFITDAGSLWLLWWLCACIRLSNGTWRRDFTVDFLIRAEGGLMIFGSASCIEVVD